ncbi:thiamine phosphate synthase [Candidatus Sororendozoicomonas aggregata]|uniref:thiamine phosphate synthase n=1 Tax=Candidatus Sororendozoicomonas aggregata TaxID=3073239 RepID=UPI002ED25DD0
MHRLKGLYGITDSRLLPDDETMMVFVEQALTGGMKVLQYRDKSSDHSRRLRQAGALKALCHHYQALLIINDDIQLAADVEADGIHLGQKDASIDEARSRLGDYAVIGISAENSLPQALTGVERGADYIAFGRFFPSSTKPDAKQANISVLKDAKKLFRQPVVAIGGITVDNAPELIAAGADMIAVVNNLFSAPDIQYRAREFSQLF